MTVLTQQNTRPEIAIQPEVHILPLPRCCPVSGNPQPGSVLLVMYTPANHFLEVYSLRKYVDQFVGGFGNVRDMEGMIQTIAEACAQALGTLVTVGALIFLQRGDAMTLIVQAGI